MSSEIPDSQKEKEKGKGKGKFSLQKGKENETSEKRKTSNLQGKLNTLISNSPTYLLYAHAFPHILCG